MKPVHSPAPLSTAPPAGSGRENASSASTRTVTPVRATPRPSGGGGSSRCTCRVAEPDAGDVEHRVGRTRRQGPDDDPQVASARHASIQPGIRCRRCDPRIHADPRSCGLPRRGVTCRCARSGSASRPTAPRSPSASTGSSTRWSAHELVEAVPHDDDGPASRPRPGVRRPPAHRSTPSGSRGPYDELVGQDRVVPYVFPTPAMTQGMPLTASRRDARPSRPVRLRHDDPRRAGHLGGRDELPSTAR